MKPMSIDRLSFPQGIRPAPSGWAAQAARIDMHSILLVIPKPETGMSGAEQTWKSIAPGLQLRATQSCGVKTLYENCWLITAEENGLSFFDHAITVADKARLRCRICLLGRPHDGFARSPSNPGLKRPVATTLRIFHGTLGSIHKLLVRGNRAG
jgi:hypothetical protein